MESDRTMSRWSWRSRFLRTSCALYDLIGGNVRTVAFSGAQMAATRAMSLTVSAWVGNLIADKPCDTPVLAPRKLLRDLEASQPHFTVGRAYTVPREEVNCDCAHTGIARAPLVVGPVVRIPLFHR